MSITPLNLDQLPPPIELWKEIKTKKNGERNFVVLAEPIFDLIMDLKSGKIAASNELRPRIISLLEEFEEGARHFYKRDSIIQAAKYGLVLFIDETILQDDFVLKEEWEKWPLSGEIFGETFHLKFYEKLEAMFRQIDMTVDIVEVYYTCMLLGYRGKYAVYEQNRFLKIIEKTADALLKAGKAPISISIGPE